MATVWTVVMTTVGCCYDNCVGVVMTTVWNG